MKYSKEFKQYVMKLGFFCRYVVYAHEYEISYSFNERDHPDDDDGHNITATITIDVDYLYAHINIYPEMFKAYLDKDYYSIAKQILHEFCHILTHPIKMYPIDLGLLSPVSEEDLRKITERQTQRIRNCLLNTLPNNWHSLDNLNKFYNKHF